LLGGFGVETPDQLGGVFEIGKQHSDLLTLACQSAPGREDLFGQVVGGIGERRLGLRGEGCGGRGGRLAAERHPAFAAKRKPGRILKATVRATSAQCCPAATTKIHALWIRKTTARAVHKCPFMLLLDTRYIRRIGQTTDARCGALPVQLSRRSPHCFWSRNCRDSARQPRRY